MAKVPDQYDVWFIAADTIYRGVPLGVVTDWAIQGRLGPTDKVRPAGTQDAWMELTEHPKFVDFLFRGGQPAPTGPTAYAEQLEPIEMDAALSAHEEEDDDPDMIPLIDISLVLLVFFMMTTAVAALSPVDVPALKNVGEASTEKDVITIQIDKQASGMPFFAIRVGETPPSADDNNLQSPEDALARLDILLGQSAFAREVRIACHKDLPRGWVRDLAKELDKRRIKNQISFYGAEVNQKAD